MELIGILRKGFKMSEWKLIIKRVDNGYILKGKFGDTDLVTEVVIPDHLDELEGMKNLLYEVMEYFGVFYGKHNKKNIVIEILENKK